MTLEADGISYEKGGNMEDIEIDEYSDGSYGICFSCKEYIRYLNPHIEGIVKLEV